MITGLLHVHSNYSYDGRNTIKEYADWGKRNNVRFIILTEHEDGFTQERFNTFKNECLLNSDKDLLIIPAIEYSFGEKSNIHINIVGCDEFLTHNKKIECIPEFLKLAATKGAFSILNHPKKILNHIKHIDLISLDAIEIWNTKNDFSYAPFYSVNKFILSSSKKYYSIVCSDLHQIPNSSFAKIIIYDELLSTSNIIKCLKSGSFYTQFKKSIIHPKHKQSNKMFLMVLAHFHSLIYSSLKIISRKFKIPVSTKIVNLIKLKNK